MGARLPGLTVSHLASLPPVTAVHHLSPFAGLEIEKCARQTDRRTDGHSACSAANETLGKKADVVRT